MLIRISVHTLVFASLLIVGCGPGASQPITTTPQVEPNTFQIAADPVEFEAGSDTSLDVRFNRGEGFTTPVTFEFEPGDGLKVDPKTYAPAEDEDTASTTLTARKAGSYTVDVIAKPDSGEEQKITVKVTVKVPTE